MLGRKTYTQAEVDRARTAIEARLSAYRDLAAAAGDDPKARSAREAFESGCFNDLALALDRPFVHRMRIVTGTGGTPLNELELICDAIMNHDGQFRGSTVIAYAPERSVVGLTVGDQVRLTADDVERLAAGCFAELEEKFVD